MSTQTKFPVPTRKEAIERVTDSEHSKNTCGRNVIETGQSTSLTEPAEKSDANLIYQNLRRWFINKVTTLQWKQYQLMVI